MQKIADVVGNKVLKEWHVDMGDDYIDDNEDNYNNENKDNNDYG